MHIAMLNTLYPPNVVGGAERSVQILAESLVNAGQRVSIITLALDGVFKERLYNGVHVYEIPLRNIYMPFQQKSFFFLRSLWHSIDIYNQWMARQVSNILAKINPHIVHTHNLAGFSVAVWTMSKKMGLPVVHTIRDYYLMCPRATMFKNGINCSRICFLCRFFSMPKRRLTRYVDAVTGVSRFVIKRHVSHGYFQNIKQVVIYNGYNISAVASVLKKTKKRSNDSKQPARSIFRFGYLGQLNETKGIEMLLQAFLALPSGCAELWIAGKGETDYEAHLKNISKWNNNIYWLGFVPPVKLLQAVDILVVPSLWHDPAPRVVLEAASGGIPVIGALRGGIPELIAENKTGFLFDPDIPGDLEKVMRQSIDSWKRVKMMGQESQEWVKRFSPEGMARAYLQVYEHELNKVT